MLQTSIQIGDGSNKVIISIGRSGVIFNLQLQKVPKNININHKLIPKKCCTVLKSSGQAVPIQ